MDGGWDKKMVSKLTQLGLSHDMAMSVVGIVANHSQQVYMQGYEAGYNDGYTKKSLSGAGEKMFYIDYAAGRFEAWFYSEGRRYSAGTHGTLNGLKNQILKKDKKAKFNLTEEARNADRRMS